MSTIDEVSNEVLSLQSEQLVINLDKVEEETKLKGENGEMIELTADGSFTVIETQSDDFVMPPEVINEATINSETGVATETITLVKHDPSMDVGSITEITSISKQEISTTYAEGANGNEDGTHVECDLDPNHPSESDQPDKSIGTDEENTERSLSHYQTFTNYRSIDRSWSHFFSLHKLHGKFTVKPVLCLD